MSDFNQICHLSQPSLSTWFGFPTFSLCRQQEDSPVLGNLADLSLVSFYLGCELSQGPVFVHSEENQIMPFPLSSASGTDGVLLSFPSSSQTSLWALLSDGPWG